MYNCRYNGIQWNPRMGLVFICRSFTRLRGEEMNKSGTCPFCAGPLKRETRSMAAEYKLKVIQYDQPGAWCDKCSEGFLGPEDLKNSRVARDKVKNEIDKERRK